MRYHMRYTILTCDGKPESVKMLETVVGKSFSRQNVGLSYWRTVKNETLYLFPETGLFEAQHSAWVSDQTNLEGQNDSTDEFVLYEGGSASWDSDVDKIHDQIIVTGSNHIINRFRTLIHDGIIPRECVYIKHYTYKEGHRAEHDIFIDANGCISWQPNGFCDEWNKALDILMQDTVPYAYKNAQSADSESDVDDDNGDDEYDLLDEQNQNYNEGLGL